MQLLMSAEAVQRLIINMKFFLIILLFVCAGSSAQQKNKKLQTAVGNFYSALLDKDTAVLKLLTDDKLVYGHSNGWNQGKTELINDLFNGKLTYSSIKQSNEEIVVDKNTACVRGKIDVTVVMSATKLNFNLYSLMVWIYKKGSWKLLSRQGIKL